ncbi:hypothetical protein RSAG8_12562, partial [Rhizoctonia solani AG-8 WAC10335]
MPSWNTDEETNWLVSTILPQFREFSRSGVVELDGEKLTPMAAFKKEIVREFGIAFPSQPNQLLLWSSLPEDLTPWCSSRLWRIPLWEKSPNSLSYCHPDTDVSEYPEDLQELQIRDAGEWESLGEKFRHRLNYLKKMHYGEPGDTDDGHEPHQDDTEAIAIEDVLFTEPPLDAGDETVEAGEIEPTASRTGRRLKNQCRGKKSNPRTSAGPSKSRGSTKGLSDQAG